MIEEKKVSGKSMNPSSSKVAPKSPTKPQLSSKQVAIVLVRGLVRVPGPVKDTLQMLRLVRCNFGVVVNNTPVMQGMITKVKDYVTWGEIDDDTFSELIQKRGEEFKGRVQDGKKNYSYATFNFKGKKYKTYFRLNPPRKGFGRKGIKVGFVSGGALGYRGAAINDLVRRML